MLGIAFAKAQPTTYLLQYRGGKVVREGAGLSFFYYGPTSTVSAVPVGSRDEPFIFELVTHDFQSVTVQGQIAYRVCDPRRAASMLDFALRADGRNYLSDDYLKLPQRVSSIAEVLLQQAVKDMAIKDALRASEIIAREVASQLSTHPEVVALGLEVLGVSVLAIKPTPEMARALEAEAREIILRTADEAIFSRRNAAVEQERAIRESELDTEVAVELKKRLIRETQMEAEASVKQKRHELERADMEASIKLEARRKDLVVGQAENSRTLAEAEAYRVAVVMKALESADPRVVQALVAAGMQPGQLIAQAFGGIAERAERIGSLNMSPELLQSLLDSKLPAEVERGRRS
ncbi:MAG TPA: SPFH domain-containing protein [Candidatus Accumulibacter phosphatis]|nr:MAG: SPFH domain / Band 7 family protein [Candidatus Accumulibacter sp. SK-11]HCN67080.1 membrane protease subunit, stomatin/prohibitin [Accumulibacter sp.]HRL77056.1 SPFH domain-containing protein [Candidatus Accumulibacter phosphatis]HRQ96455.1 SPFH domain-containing protein [Candidatus Accumulibacter phosphatis]